MDAFDETPKSQTEGTTDSYNPTAPLAPKDITHDDADQRRADAQLKAAEGESVEGKVELSEIEGGVKIHARVSGASPGKHGFHIHEKGDCSDIPGKSMGGHFNPTSKIHKLPSEGEDRHLGDLGNIELGDDKKGELEILIKDATLHEDKPNSFLGKAFVVHSGEDKGEAHQPSGDSGTPIACGVIVKD